MPGLRPVGMGLALTAGLCLAATRPGLAAQSDQAGQTAQTTAPAAAVPPALREATAAFQQGYADAQSGKLEAARSEFEKVVRLAPQIAEGHAALGSVLIALGKPAAAIPELEAAAGLKPGDAQIEADLGRACSQAGQPERAVTYFAAAIAASHTPLDPAAYDAYGRALAATGHPEEALAQFEQEEKLTGPNGAVDDAIGSVYAQMQRWSEARTALERAVQESADALPRIHLSVLLRRENDPAGALAVIEPAVGGAAPSRDAYPADAWAEYGRVLAALGRDEQAATALEQALQEDPACRGAAGDLAMTLQRMGRQQEAIPWFEKAVAADPGNATLLANLGLAMTLSGNAKEALQYLARAQAADPASPTILKDRGVADIQLSDFDQAILDFKAALALDPGDPQLHYDLGLAYKFKDRLDEAAAELAQAGQMDPTLEDPPYTLGILDMQRGKLDEAVTELRKVVTLRPDNGNAWAILGSTLKQNNQLEEAQQALEKAVPLLPAQPGPRVTLAGVLADEAANLSAQADAAEASGNTGTAESLRARMKALRTQAAEYRRQSAALSQAAVSRQRANFALNAGNQLMVRGQIADAIARYQESIAADPGFAEPHVQLALAYDRQGRAQEAAAEREAARKLAAAQP